jgi:hypothetical protein
MGGFVESRYASSTGSFAPARGNSPPPRAELNDRLHSGLKKLIGQGGCCFEREEKGENGPARMITDFLIIAKGTPADSPGTKITFFRYKFTSGRCHFSEDSPIPKSGSQTPNSEI